jgi:hypothetical protein
VGAITKLTMNEGWFGEPTPKLSNKKNGGTTSKSGSQRISVGTLQTLQGKVKQLVAVDVQELKPYSTLNLSQTQTFEATGLYHSIISTQ